MKYITLDQLQQGQSAIIIAIHFVNGSIRRRFMDLGVIPDTKITCVLKSPHGGPIAYKIKDTVYAFRIDDAKQIDIMLLADECRP